MKSKIFCAVCELFLILALNRNVHSDNDGQGMSASNDYRYTYPIMKPDSATLLKWIDNHEHAPKVFIDNKFMGTTLSRGSLSLLSYLNYKASERRQETCGNCWVWAGTGIIEIALNTQEGIKDRLSIQYLNSCHTNEYACCGGDLTEFKDFYDVQGFAIPWSNTNAYYQDTSKVCPPHTSSVVSCDSIAVDISYPFLSISNRSITTHNVDQVTAITNIKNVLHQNKGVWFGFYLPIATDWENFYDFWDNQNEDAVWNPNLSCGHTWKGGEGGGHAVLVVGYNDIDPNNSYWIVLNSWGVADGNRLNGLFRLDMDINYDCDFYYPYPFDEGYIQSFYFETLDVEFAQNATSTTTTIAPEVNLTPYIPFDWDGPIVPSSVKGTTSVNTLYGRKPTYIDWAIVNELSSDITEGFYTKLYIDDILQATFYSKGLLADNYNSYEDWEIDPVIKAGKHSLRIEVDSENNVVESNEDDNIYEEECIWKSQSSWPPTLYESILGEDSQEVLSSLRNFRNVVLLSNKLGKRYVNLLYEHSMEIALLLSEDPELRLHTAEIIENLLPEVRKALSGGEMNISKDVVSNFESLLDMFETKASEDLRTTIKRVRRDIAKREMLKRLEIAVE